MRTSTSETKRFLTREKFFVVVVVVFQITIITQDSEVLIEPLRSESLFHYLKEPLLKTKNRDLEVEVLEDLKTYLFYNLGNVGKNKETRDSTMGTTKTLTKLM